jgi:hypothetical protein
MKTLKFSKIPTTHNTVLSDCNEVLTGYYINKQKWYSQEAENQHNLRASQMTGEQYADCAGKAIVMAQEFIKWAKQHGYSSTVKNVWWTARPGIISKITGYEVDQKKNPSDILVLFSSGPNNGFLGLSAKATKGSGDIGFKNPGLGTIEKALKINLRQIVDNDINLVIKTFKLSQNANQRKQEIRAKSNTKSATEEIGKNTLSKLRDVLYNKLTKLSQKELLKYIVSDWMDAEDKVPKYIKVTGHGTTKYHATVTDTTKNEKLEALTKGPIKLQKVGNATVMISSNGKKIMNMRFKWESQALASALKASGDPLR